MATRTATFNLSDCTIREIHPHEIRFGDHIGHELSKGGFKWGEPVIEVAVNPRGCIGHTHINKTNCYDNVATITVARPNTKRNAS